MCLLVCNRFNVNLTPFLPILCLHKTLNKKFSFSTRASFIY